MTLDEHYICQRAANAIISEIGPFRVSTDALQAINQFLDEFIILLLTCSLSLDLSEIKSVVFSLLPSTLGKNAIVEAELEVKTFTETESIDYDLYERMRKLGQEEDRFPLAEAVPLLREKCFEYCTLADKDDQLYLQKSLRKRNEDTKVIISPIVAIYVTTVMEHIAEYLLTAVAMTAEHEDTDYVRVKEVFLSLIDDIQLGDVFNRMDLRDKMEKRSGLINNSMKTRNSYLPPPSPNPMSNNNRKSYTLDTQLQNENTGSFLDITFDDLDLDYFEENNRKSTTSRIPDMSRPQSAMSTSSNYTFNTNNNNANRKSTFHLFKNNRNSFSEQPRAQSPINNNNSSSSNVYDPDAPTMDFDDLIKSGGTVKVSLTPNRLRSIEIKDQTKDELSPPAVWERRSNTASSASTRQSSRPSTPLMRQNTVNSVKSTSSSNNSSNKPSIDVPNINSIRPSSPLGKKSFTVNETTRFENPRDAPKPPLSPTIPAAKKIAFPKSPPTPLPSINATTTTTSSIASTIATTAATHTSPIASQSSDSLSEISSVTSMPSSILSTGNNSTPSISESLAISIQEPPPPRPTKSIPLNSMVIRRSSVSSKKSRDSLRIKKEEQMKSPLIKDEPVPTAIVMNDEVKKELPVVLTEEPAELPASREIHFDNNQKKVQQDEEIEKQEELVKEDTSIVLVEEPSNIVEEEIEKNADTPVAEENNNIKILVESAIPRKKAATLSPERPSSMVAKRASMVVNNRRRSLHESYATEKHQDVILRQRASNVGSVSVSIKQWDDILKPEEQQTNVIPPAAHRRSVLRQLRQQQLKEQLQLQQDLVSKEGVENTSDTTAAATLYSNNNGSNAVLDKVLKFERASSLDDVAHQRVSHMPRRERFLYLQQDPSAIERKSTITKAIPKTVVTPPVRRPQVVGVDQGCQTDPVVIGSKKKQENSDSESDIDSDEKEEEHGLVDGDEEWFLQDDEWDEQEETAIVEWLLGE